MTIECQMWINRVNVILDKSQPIYTQIINVKRDQKSTKYKHMKITTSQEKRMQNAANKTGYSAMKTPRSIIGRQSPQTAHGPLGVPPKNPKRESYNGGVGETKILSPTH